MDNGFSELSEFQSKRRFPVGRGLLTSYIFNLSDPESEIKSCLKLYV